MKKLISLDDRTQLYLLKSILESEDIICFIKNEYPPAAGELPPISAMPELWIVNNNQYDQAMALIQENLLSPQPSISWTCPQCGEELEGQFTTCWRCGVNKS